MESQVEPPVLEGTPALRVHQEVEPRWCTGSCR